MEQAKLRRAAVPLDGAEHGESFRHIAAVVSSEWIKSVGVLQFGANWSGDCFQRSSTSVLVLVPWLFKMKVCPISELCSKDTQLEMERWEAAAWKRSVCPMIQFVMNPP